MTLLSSQPPTPPPPLPPEFIAFAHELASAAGSVILKYWRLPTTIHEKFEFSRVSASSPVTAADRDAEKAMRILIAARYPSHGVLGEEFGPSPCSQLGEITSADLSEWTWVLDPIDGTKSFITGKPLFGTLIALCHHGEPVLGVIDQCVLAERWVGTCVETTFNAKRIRATSASCPELVESLCYATTPHMFRPGYEAAAIHALRSRIKRMLYGCDCYAYALLASDFGVHLVCEADLQPYDYLALVPILRGAGATITDWTGQPLTLHSTTVQGRVLAAASDHLHAKALAIIRRPPLSFYLSSYPNLSLAFAFAAGAACSAALVLRR